MDSDWAGDLLGRQSTTGGGVILRRSKHFAETCRVCKRLWRVQAEKRVQARTTAQQHGVLHGDMELEELSTIFRMLIEKTASQSHTEQGHRKIMEDVLCAHPPAEAEPDRTVVAGVFAQ